MSQPPGRNGEEAVSESHFRRIARVKQDQNARALPPQIGQELIAFFKKEIQKPHTKLGDIAGCWQQMVPERILVHTSLDGFVGGTLRVLVDTPSHLYELKNLLLGGLEKKILDACRKHGLRRITLKPGRPAGELGVR